LFVSRAYVRRVLKRRLKVTCGGKEEREVVFWRRRGKGEEDEQRTLLVDGLRGGNHRSNLLFSLSVF